MGYKHKIYRISTGASQEQSSRQSKRGLIQSTKSFQEMSLPDATALSILLRYVREPVG